MLEFLKNYDKYEYATKDSRHLAASLVLRAIERALIMAVAIGLTGFVTKLFCVLGVFGW